MNLDRTRRQANQAAWYSDEPGPLGLRNPFGKWKPKRQNTLASVENGEERAVLAHSQTAPDVSSSSGVRNPAFTIHQKEHAASTPVNSKPTDEASRIDFGQPNQSPRSSIHDREHATDDQNEGDPVLNGNHLSTDKSPEEGVRNRGEGKKEKHSVLGLFKSNETEKSVDGNDDDGNGKNKNRFTWQSQIRATLFNSWVNILLIASPVGIAINFTNVNPIAVFVVNFIAIIPLAGMLSYATEEIALRTGEVLGGLLNASFGNAVELIVSIIALVKDQVLIVQTSLIGSMLSNLLLVMGMCFFFGGINRIEQAFNMTVAQTAASLLFLAVSSLIIPTAFDEWANTGNNSGTATAGAPKPGVAALSRGTAIMLLIVYGCYLFFQLKSHTEMYNAPSEKNQTRNISEKFKKAIPSRMRRRSVEDNASSGASAAEKDEDDAEEPQLSIWVAVLTLAISTVLVAVNAEFLVDSINAITCGGGISKNFVGLILLPIVGNAAEHATAVTVAVKDKMDLAIGVAVGSSMQIALLVLPFVVVLGWIIGKDDMTLFFDGFQIAVLFVSVLLVNYLIQDGKSHWLEGVLLMTLYIIIAVAAWFYPTAPGLSDCPS